MISALRPPADAVCRYRPEPRWQRRAARAGASDAAAVVRRLACDGHVMDMAFVQSRARDLHEGRVVTELLEVVRAGVAHGGAEAPRELMQHVAGRSLVRHL